MSKKPTATLLEAMKRDAKRRAKGPETSYNALLEEVARENGFDSWFAAMELHKNLALTSDDKFELIVDPLLPKDFDNTPNEERSEAQITRWWLRPFANSLPHGGFEVRCLDGGAWDRATFYGVAQSLDDAKTLAREKLANWRRFLDRPMMTFDDDGRCNLTVDSLHPAWPRAIVYSCDNQELATTMLEAWDHMLKTDPELAQVKLARAREQAKPYVPTEAEMQEQYALLSRLSILEAEPSRGRAQTPHPLRADIARCVELGFIIAEQVESSGVRKPAPAIWHLSLSDSGRRVLQMFEDHLEATGQK